MQSWVVRGHTNEELIPRYLLNKDYKTYCYSIPSGITPENCVWFTRCLFVYACYTPSEKAAVERI